MNKDGPAGIRIQKSNTDTLGLWMHHHRKGANAMRVKGLTGLQAGCGQATSSYSVS